MMIMNFPPNLNTRADWKDMGQQWEVLATKRSWKEI